MARQMKYIVFELCYVGGRLLHDVPFVFPDHLIHADVARNFGSSAVVESAGFCSLALIAANPRPEGQSVPYMVEEKDQQLGVRWICWGESQSLDVKSNPETDQKLLDRDYR